MTIQDEPNLVAPSLLAARIAGEAVAACLRADTTICGIVMEPGTDTTRRYDGSSTVLCDTEHMVWVLFGGVWAIARFLWWTRNQEPLEQLQNDEIQGFITDLSGMVEATGASEVLIDLDPGELVEWVVELEIVWDAALGLLLDILASVIDGHPMPQENDIRQSVAVHQRDRAELRPILPALLAWASR